DRVAGRREELRATYLRLLAELARLHEARGEPERAVEVLERLVIADPPDEAAYVALMRLHAALGQRQQALRRYGQLRQALRRDLDAEPARATRRLYQAILAGQTGGQDPGAGGREDAGDRWRLPARGPRPPAPNHNLPAPLTSFVGRAREIAE